MLIFCILSILNKQWVLVLACYWNQYKCCFPSFPHLLFLINPWWCCSRCQVDISALPMKQTNCLKLPLEKHPGSLLMLIAVAPCTGVSISDLCVCPLGDPSERQQISQRYVSFLYFTTSFFFFFSFSSFESSQNCRKKENLSSDNNMFPTRENYCTK